MVPAHRYGKAAAIVLISAVSFMLSAAIWQISAETREIQIEAHVRAAATKEPREELDLQAQREMSLWAFWMMVISGGSLLVTAAGTVFVALTLNETRKATNLALLAARDAEKATAAAQASVMETTRIGEAQVRCYLNVVSCGLERMFGQPVADLNLSLRNSGQSPAHAVTLTIRISMNFRGEGWSRMAAGLVSAQTGRLLNRHHVVFVGAGETIDLRGLYRPKDYEFSDDTGDWSLYETSAHVTVWFSGQDVFGRGVKGQVDLQGAINAPFHGIIKCSTVQEIYDMEEHYDTYAPEQRGFSV